MGSTSDDERVLCDILALELEDGGFSVTKAYSGNHALELFEIDKPDLIVSDIRMPDGDGIYLLNEIKRRYPTVPVVLFITAFADISEAEALNLGSEAVFKKPVNYENLISRARECLKAKPFCWVRSSDRFHADFSVNLSFESAKNAVDAKVFNLGKGGMFLKIDGPLPQVKEYITFDISFKDGKYSPCRGKAICRWVRETADKFPRGVGLEFLEIDEVTCKNLTSLMADLKSSAYIPIN